MFTIALFNTFFLFGKFLFGLRIISITNLSLSLFLSLLIPIIDVFFYTFVAIIWLLGTSLPQCACDIRLKLE